MTAGNMRRHENHAAAMHIASGALWAALTVPDTHELMIRFFAEGRALRARTL